MSAEKFPRGDIDFQCRFGIWPFEKRLNISSEGFEWCGRLIPLEGIDRLRWGVELRRGGIFPKRVYVVVFAAAGHEYRIKTKQKDFYANLVEYYWKTAGVRLLQRLLDDLAAGESRLFGPLTEVCDSGMAIEEKSFPGISKRKFYEWDKLVWGVLNGSLCFAAREAPAKPLTGLSFLWVDNAHILLTALKLFSQNSGIKKLSEIPRNFI